MDGVAVGKGLCVRNGTPGTREQHICTAAV
jgi:hypothetical protein